MRQNSLKPKGLSLSEAQSISNQCNQRCIEINAQLAGITNYTKSIEIDGKVRVIQNGQKIPENIVNLILQKSKLHAVQGFLMENIHAKEQILKNLQNARYETTLEQPEYPEYKTLLKVKEVSEEWGWEQLSLDELAKYSEATSYASHIGQFIHKGFKLAHLRDELPKLPAIEWIELEVGKKHPIDINVHHTSTELLNIHETFAERHREYENTVNYYKAKVMNLVTAENARIARVNGEELARINNINADLREKYNSESEKYNAEYQKLSNIFEEERQERIKNAASLKIEIHSNFQDIITILRNKEIKE